VSEPDIASAPPGADALETLRTGPIELVGRMPWSSNATFLVEVGAPGPAGQVRAVYKPERGERPLWDFPSGLYRREIAAYLISEALGWRLVPATIERDGPLGIGSVQQFIVADFEHHYFTLYEQDHYHDQLQRVCAFDIVVNSTDRKSGHCLVDADDRVWAIDNGLAFHVEFKLRTVIWEFGGEPLPDPLIEDLTAFCDRGLPDGLTDLLDGPECEAILVRTRMLLRAGCFPTDTTGRRFPWPLV
jgi:uncharacterized repeat protein (TIGR03843 family)